MHAVKSPQGRPQVKEPVLKIDGRIQEQNCENEFNEMRQGQGSEEPKALTPDFHGKQDRQDRKENSHGHGRDGHHPQIPDPAIRPAGIMLATR